MRNPASVSLLILLCFCAAVPMASATTVISGAAFTGGLTGTWQIEYTSGASDLFLKSVTIDLTHTDLRFDTVSGGFGSLSSLDVSGIGLSGPGTPSLVNDYARGAALDGGTLLTFSFLDFAPGDSFQFSVDVDHPDPLPGPLLGLRRLAAQTVGPNGMAGALVTFTFGGTNYNTTPIKAVFPVVTLLDIITGLARGEGVVAFNNNTGTNGDVSNPEPACLATFGAGLGLLIALARRRLA